jgi:hypothetical protein
MMHDTYNVKPFTTRCKSWVLIVALCILHVTAQSSHVNQTVAFSKGLLRLQLNDKHKSYDLLFVVSRTFVHAGAPSFVPHVVL